MNSKFANNSVDRSGGSKGEENQTNSWQRNLQWVDAASDTRPRTLGFHSAGQLTLDRCYIRAPGAERWAAPSTVRAELPASEG